MAVKWSAGKWWSWGPRFDGDDASGRHHPNLQRKHESQNIGGGWMVKEPPWWCGVPGSIVTVFQDGNYQSLHQKLEPQNVGSGWVVKEPPWWFGVPGSMVTIFQDINYQNTHWRLHVSLFFFFLSLVFPSFFLSSFFFLSLKIYIGGGWVVRECSWWSEAPGSIRTIFQDIIPACIRNSNCKT